MQVLLKITSQTEIGLKNILIYTSVKRPKILNASTCTGRKPATKARFKPYQINNLVLKLIAISVTPKSRGYVDLVSADLSATNQLQLMAARYQMSRGQLAAKTVSKIDQKVSRNGILVNGGMGGQ